jgi:hypothetical protein
MMTAPEAIQSLRDGALVIRSGDIECKMSGNDEIRCFDPRWKLPEVLSVFDFLRKFKTSRFVAVTTDRL